MDGPIRLTEIGRIAEMQGDAPVRLKVIAPGWGSSGYYSAEMLKRDGPRVFREGTQMYADHPTRTEERDRPERSIKDLAGVLKTAAYWAEGPAGPGLYAEAEMLGSWRYFLEQAAPHIGVSIRAMGEAQEGEAEGRRGKVIQSLTDALSVDLVTRAGAGGKVLPLYESARGEKSDEEERHMAENNELREALDKLSATTTELAEARREAQEAKAKVTEQEQTITTLRAREAQLVEQVAKQSAAIVTATKLAESKLPEAARKRVAQVVEAYAMPLTEGLLNTDEWAKKVDGAIAEESAYLASLGSGVKGFGVHQGGKSDVDVTESLKDSFLRLGYDQQMAERMAKGREA